MMQRTQLEKVHRDLETVDFKGNKIILKGVAQLFDKNSGNYFVHLEDIVKSRQTDLALKQKISEKSIPILELLYADLPIYGQIIKGLKVEKGQIIQSTRFHKMLFELWQKTIDHKYDEAYPHHEFYADVYGPVSRDFKPTMHELEKEGLVEMHQSKKNGDPSTFKLTKKGFEASSELWNETPDEIKEIILKTKDRLAIATSKEIIDYFHNEYPEYKREKYSKSKDEKRRIVSLVMEKYKKIEADD